MALPAAPFILRNLDDQGFGDLSDVEKARFAWPIRFTPAVSIALVAVGLALPSPVLLSLVALMGLAGAFFPHGMPIDLFYNGALRHLFHRARLPPTPMPRRFSYLISAVLLFGSATSFYLGYPWAGWILGGAVFTAGLTLTTTLWCLGSFLYKQGRKALSLTTGG